MSSVSFFSLNPNLSAADLATELFIVSLLEQDLAELRAENIAEALQLQQCLSRGDDLGMNIDSANDASSQDSTTGARQNDSEMALDIFVNDARLSSDASLAASLQQARDALILADLHYAQGMNAREIKCVLDYEFARRLQDMEDQHSPASNDSDVEQILGVAMVRDLMTQSTSDIRKGKRKEVDESSPVPDVDSSGAGPSNDSSKAPCQPQSPADAANDLSDICGICFDTIQLTHSPLNASKSPNTSTVLPFGIKLSCPIGHTYCSQCLTTYIRGKIDPSNTGRGSIEAFVFPIRCPRCTTVEWPSGIEEDLASRVLSVADMELWHQQKLYDSLPKVFCPNPECSLILQEPEDGSIPHAECPACHRLMCVPCRTTWHGDMTCEQYQAIPLDDRSAEDRATFLLARSEKWSRCPDCHAMVERADGCPHMVCRCGTQFCYSCGSRWSSGKCNSSPSCATWSEEKLLAGKAQLAEAPIKPRAAPVQVPPVQVVPAPRQATAETDTPTQAEDICRETYFDSDDDLYA